MKTKRTAVVGATGYTGSELVRLLSAHPGVEVAAITSRSQAGQAVQNLNIVFGWPETAGLTQGPLNP